MALVLSSNFSTEAHSSAIAMTSDSLFELSLQLLTHVPFLSFTKNHISSWALVCSTCPEISDAASTHGVVESRRTKHDDSHKENVHKLVFRRMNAEIVSCFGSGQFFFTFQFASFLFAFSVRRIFMVRRGWHQMEVPAGWVQVLRGPRPRAEKLPSAAVERWRQPGVQPPEAARERGPDPDTVLQEARRRVASLEAALQAM